MDGTTENIRYLLWRDGVERNNWASHLAGWMQASKTRAEEVLNGAPLDDKEQINIANCHPDITPEALQYERLVKRENILRKNLDWLFEKFEHGQMKVLAQKIGVAPITISRWKSGSQKPSDSHLNYLSNYLGFKDKAIKENLLFLEDDQIFGEERKKWLIQQIEKLSKEKLDEHFKSLYLILKDP